MLGIERQRSLMERLILTGRLYVSEMAGLYGVTEETIRRDLEKLESAGKLLRIYGGAVLPGKTAEDLPFNSRAVENEDGKRAIAAAVAECIAENSTIMVDASSTCWLAVEKLQHKRGITLITNSAKIPVDFANGGFEIISTGGQLRARSLAFHGGLAHGTLRQYYPDVVLLSCKALALDKGVMESNDAESELKKRMASQGCKVTLLADHNKFDKTALVRMLEFSDLRRIITDKEPGNAWRSMLRKKSIELIVANNETVNG